MILWGVKSQLVDALDHRTESAYDATGQLLSCHDSMNATENFTYDKVGDQISCADARQ